MAKYYGDIPCVKLNGIVHITKCAKTENIIWRSLNAVTCEKCKELGSKKG